MPWDATQEGKPDGDAAGSLIDDDCQDWWVILRKCLAVLITDTSDVAPGDGMDEDNLQLLDDFLVAGAVADDAIEAGCIADDGVVAGNIAAEGVDAGALGDDASYTNARTRTHAVPLVGYSTSANLIPRGSDVYILAAPDANYASLGVVLPDGATVTAFKAQSGTHSSGAVVVTLRRVTLAGTVSTLASATLNAVEAQTDSSIDNATVDNTAYSYYVRITVSGTTTMDVNGIVITYTVTLPLP